MGAPQSSKVIKARLVMMAENEFTLYLDGNVKHYYSIKFQTADPVDPGESQARTFALGRDRQVQADTQRKHL